MDPLYSCRIALALQRIAVAVLHCVGTHGCHDMQEGSPLDFDGDGQLLVHGIRKAAVGRGGPRQPLRTLIHHPVLVNDGKVRGRRDERAWVEVKLLRDPWRFPWFQCRP